MKSKLNDIQKPGNVQEIVCDFGNLYRAMRKCSHHVKWKDSVAGYLNNGLANCLRLHESLMNGTYKIDTYTCFKIYEPKERDIVSIRFKDRVFQRSLCDNYLYNAMTKGFVRGNCACQVGKGTDDAMRLLSVYLQKHFRKHGTAGAALKMDIKNYFGSTPHEVSKAAVRKRLDDTWAYKRVADIIDSFDQGEDPTIGMGLGSQITQITQLAVPDIIDHLIKERYHIRYYIRYMDDFILIHEDMEHLKRCRDEIRVQLAALGLRVSEKKTKIFPLTQGIKFLGFKFRLTETGKVIKTLSKENIAHERRKLRKQRHLAEEGRMTKRQCDECYTSWKAHAERGNTHNLILEMDKFYKELWRNYENVQTQDRTPATQGGTPEE